ncbi:MAG: hypothetical protein IPH37_11530 [Burkholderiales bacterium]|nr:hypothetical protein [Burkholderiales bacterium]
MAQQVAPVLELEDAQAWRFVAPVRTVARASPFEADEQAEQTLGYVRVVLSKASMQRAVKDLFVLNGGIALAFAAVFGGNALVSMRMHSHWCNWPMPWAAPNVAKQGAGADQRRPRHCGHGARFQRHDAGARRARAVAAPGRA